MGRIFVKKKSIGLLISTIMLNVPLLVSAHGTEEEHKNETTLSNIIEYSGWGSVVLFIIFLVLYFLTKNKSKNLKTKKNEERLRREKFDKNAKLFVTLSSLSLVLAIALLLVPNISGNSSDSVSFTHIHGLDYTSDGEEIYVPSHNGINVYKNGKWTASTIGEPHDYMGFSMFEDGFYSSGHPSPNSDLENPFGIVKSMDNGETLEMIDLYKEIDFHGLAVGYKTKDILVYNPSENSRMKGPGFYYTTDETKTWNKILLNGLTGQPTVFAVHPSTSGVFAFGTQNGMFLSKDYGENFELVLPNVNVVSLSFDFNDGILVGTLDQEQELLRFNLNDNKTENLNIPGLEIEDAISYVKQNPTNQKEYVFATNERNIYITTNSGQDWNKIVENGISKNDFE